MIRDATATATATASNSRKTPWLVEVNRFPGLEPRDEDDRKIKYAIVRDAWKKAFERHAMSMSMSTEGGVDDRSDFDFDASIFESLSSDEGGDAKSSLERLRLERN